MRTPGIVLLLACVAFSGCTSSSTVADLAPRPSGEVTNSIRRPDVPGLIGAAANEPGIGKSLAEEQAEQIGTVGAPPIPDRALGLVEAPELPLQTAAFVPPPRPAAVPDIVDKPSEGRAIGSGTIHRHRFRDAKPINFGKASPKNLAVHGVDVSRWQGDIDWPKLRTQGANFAYIKATDGGDHLDPKFRENWRDAGKAGLKRGAYHFFYWCRTAGDQADWFIRNVPKVAGALPPVIDVEYNGESSCKMRLSTARVLEKMKVFMDKLEAHYGQRPIIYTAPDFYRDHLQGAFLKHPFWLRSVAAHPAKVYPGRKWVFWQYSGSGLSHGVSGRIDLNVFHGTEEQWRRWAG